MHALIQSGITHRLRLGMAACILLAAMPAQGLAQSGTTPFNLIQCADGWFVDETSEDSINIRYFDVGIEDSSRPPRFIDRSTDPANVEHEIAIYLRHAAMFYQSHDLPAPSLNCSKVSGDFAVVITPGLRVSGSYVRGAYTPDCPSFKAASKPGDSPGFPAAVELSKALILPRFETMMSNPGDRVFKGATTTPAHELFHAVHYNTQMGKKRCGTFSDWVSEGLAENFAVLWFEHATDQFMWDAYRDYRIRKFDQPLHQPAKPGSTGGETPISEAPDAYGTWWFWRFLGDQYDKDPFAPEITPARDHKKFNAALALDFLEYPHRPVCDESPPAKEEEHWDLVWLDRVLKCWVNGWTDARQPVEGGLYVMYPRFIAWLMDKLGKTPGNIDLIWTKCDEVTVSVGSTARLNLTVRELASQCVRLSLPGIHAADRGIVVTAYEPGSTLDSRPLVARKGKRPIYNLHLTYGLRVQEPAFEQEDWKMWRLGAGQDITYLLFSNVAPIALETQPLTNLTLEFDYSVSGEVN